MEQNASEINETTMSEGSHCDAFEFIVFVVIIGLLCIIGIFSNMTSVFVFWKHKTETTVTFLLQMLAVCDLLLLCFSIFIYTVPAFAPDSEVAVKIPYHVWPFSLITHTCTVWITVLVTYTRYRAVCIPISPNQLNLTKQIKLQVTVLVGLAIVYNMPRFWEHQPIHNESEVHLNGNGSVNESTRSVNLGDIVAYQIIYSNILYFPIMYIIPLVSLTYLNGRLIRALKAIKRKKKAMRVAKSKDDNVTVIIVVIVMVFILCQTPALLNQILWAALDQDKRTCGYFHYYYTRLSDILVIFNSSVNFFVYVLFGQKFRKIFVDTLCPACLKSSAPQR